MRLVGNYTIIIMNNKNYTLDGVDGNVYAIISYTCQAMRIEGEQRIEINKFKQHALNSESYQSVIDKCSDMLCALNSQRLCQ